jgi:hypothetical protein
VRVLVQICLGFGSELKVIVMIHTPVIFPNECYEERLRRVPRPINWSSGANKADCEL